MYKTLGAVIWVTLFATVMTSVVRSEKIIAAPNAAVQHHHIGKAHQQIAPGGVAG